MCFIQENNTEKKHEYGSTANEVFFRNPQYAFPLRRSSHES